MVVLSQPVINAGLGTEFCSMITLMKPIWVFLFCLFLLVNVDAADRPNVVIFLADDAGWGDYSHSGNQHVSTPNIDSIATAGVSLDRFFVCPVCAPTRAEMLTGRYHPRGGVRGVSTGQERLDLTEKTLADAFKAAGYTTGAFGKWHNGSQWPYHPMARGFDEYFGYSAGHWGEYFDAPLEDNGRTIRSTGYIVDVCTDRALQFIEKNHDRPFLCYVPFTTPHSPWSVPAKDWARFKSLLITQQGAEGDQIELDHTRCVLAMIENQDWNVGRVLSKLDEHRLRNNTIVLYFSDNGPNTMRWNGGMKGKKGGTDEGSVRSVCYLQWPTRLPSGQTVKPITGAIDLLPTLTSLAGIPRVGDKPLDGRDLSPLLFRHKTSWPDRMIFSTWSGKISVRTERHRLDDRGCLYDLVDDPGQTSPANEHDTATANRLLTAVKEWRKEMFGVSAIASASEKRNLPNAIVTTASKRVYPMDARPLTVGYREFPLTILPARDGEPRGGVDRSGSAPNSSYFVNWTSKEDSMVWQLDVNTTGRYEVVIDYTCPEADAGSQIELSCGTSRLTGRVRPGWNPPLYTNQDTLPRSKSESTMKEFRPLSLGMISLKRGQAPLTLRALEIPGESVMDVLGITLTLLADDAAN